MKDDLLQRVPHIGGDSEEDTDLLLKMAETARAYIQSFAWCPAIDEILFGDGVGGIVAVFLVRFSSKIGGADDELWVVVGDLPSAYMVVEAGEAPSDALAKYCELMEDWAAAVTKRGSLKAVFPVSAPATVENAFLLQQRLRFLREEIIGQPPPFARRIKERWPKRG